jgi:hypothetical protein
VFLFNLLVKELKEMGIGIALRTLQQLVETGLLKQPTGVDKHDIIVNAVKDKRDNERGFVLLLCSWEVNDT